MRHSQFSDPKPASEVLGTGSMAQAVVQTLPRCMPPLVCRTSGSRSLHSEGVDLLPLADFHELLKWGIISGVNDGCEPEPQEIQDMINRDMNLPR